MARPSEDALIARYFAPLATQAGADGLADDAAVLPDGEGDLVVTKDMLVAGVHFLPEDPPDLVARKALRVNLSDLAAKGAAPKGFLLGLGLPPGWSEAFLESFARGLAEDIQDFGCPLFGGDTVKLPGPLTVSVTAFGRAARTVRRRGARPGDSVCVTGTIGDAALGLAVRLGAADPEKAPDWLRNLPGLERAQLAARYLLPQPRTTLAEAVARHASAAMDVSDGLAGDLGKLLAASQVSAEVEAAAVPLSGAARAALERDPGLLAAILTGGDDYELLLTCPPEAVAALAEAAAEAGCGLVEIGRTGEGEGLTVRDSQGRAMDLGTGRYQHF